MDEETAITAILSHYENYGFDKPVVGFVGSSINFTPEKKLLSFGDGSWVEVKESDLVYIDLTDAQKNAVFPFCDL